jgi:hypothetical protein
MALVLADRVLETTTVAGTGNAALSGAQANYQPFSVIGNGSTTYYTIVDNTNNEWEVGVGTYVSAGNYISRDTVLSSSNGGALVYFGSGDKDIFLDLPSEAVLLSAGDVTGPASAVANNFAAFNMTTGKLIKDSGYNASSFATAAQGALADTAIQPGDLGTAAYLDAGSANGVATLDAGGKVPTSQIPQMGDLNYQGTWNASTNTPTLTSSAGTKGFYYVVSVAGSTNLNGITDWKVGDWAVFNGSVWEKIDNTDAVTSVNGLTGTVVLTTTNIAEGTNEYFTTAKARASVSAGTGISYDSGAGVITNSAPDQTVALTDGTAIDVTGTYPNFTINNTAPDQVVALTAGTGISTSGTYPNFTISNTSPSLGGDVVGPASATDNAIARYNLTTGKLIQNSTVTVTDNGDIANTNSVEFDITPTTLPTAQGTLYWDNADAAQTLSLVMEGGNAIQQIGQEQYYRIKCSAAVTEGQVVMVTGTVGASGGLTGAPATGLTASTASYVMGVATESGALNDWIYVTSFGLVRGINTTGGAEAWIDGQILYYDPTVAGGLTKNLPSAPNPKVQVCAVVHAASNGSLFIRPSFGGILGQYEGDVQVTTPANGDLLIRNQTSGKWVNAPLTAGTGISIGNAAGAVTVTNSAPDQTVAITGAGGAIVTGTYPNFTITTPSGTVTSVTGTAPIASTGGATPAISISQATTSTNGYLSSTDWNTFNNKSNTTGTVTSVGGTGTVNGITLTGTVTSSGNLTLGGTLGGIGNSQLTNSAVTVGTTAISLGASSTTLAGLTSVTSTNLTATAAVTGSVVSATNGLVINNMTIGASYTIPSGYSASSVGAVTIASGVTVTVPSGSRWVVL